MTVAPVESVGPVVMFGATTVGGEGGGGGGGEEMGGGGEGGVRGVRGDAGEVMAAGRSDTSELLGGGPVVRQSGVRSTLTAALVTMAVLPARLATVKVCVRLAPWPKRKLPVAGDARPGAAAVAGGVTIGRGPVQMLYQPVIAGLAGTRLPVIVGAMVSITMFLAYRPSAGRSRRRQVQRHGVADRVASSPRRSASAPYLCNQAAGHSVTAPPCR